MKFANTLLSTLLISQLVWGGFGPAAFAATDATPPAQAVKTVKLNPELLRQWIVYGNIGILEELNNIHIAKEKVNVDYTNLLPSLNLGAMLQSGTSLILSAVTFLLPFLMPSNWINIRTDKELFASEELTYKILQLNTYSSALEIYYTILSNQALETVYAQQATDLAAIANSVSRQIATGMSTKRDLQTATGQLDAAKNQVSKTQEMIAAEILALQQAMGFPDNVKPILAASSVGEVKVDGVSVETGTEQSAIDQANGVAPEAKQIGLMQLAAQHEKWSAVFAFINGTEVMAGSNGQIGSGTNSVSTTNLVPRGTLDLGFSAFTQYQVNQSSKDALKLRMTEVLLGNQTTVGTAFESLDKAKEQLETATDEETNYQHAYDTDYQHFLLGTLALTDLYIDRSALSNASLAKAEAELDVNVQRTMLNRALLTDEFALIPGCASQTQAKGQTGTGKFLRGLFGGKKDRTQLDSLCHAPDPSTVAATVPAA